MTSTADSPFATLGISPDAGPEEIAAAYRKLVRRYPPELAPDRFAAIHGAYQMLTSPAHRMETARAAPEVELTRLFPLPAVTLKPAPPPPPPISADDLEPLFTPVRRAVVLRLLAGAFRS
jgi:curved DNA-binding protein CbpA